MMTDVRRQAGWLLGLVGLAVATWAAAPAAELFALRDEGVAHLENERPKEAAKVFRKLTKKSPDRPLGHANLAIALLRQQETDEALKSIRTALRLAPRRGDLHAIEGQILGASGDHAAAVGALRKAGRLEENDPEIQFELLRAAKLLRNENGEAALDEALGRLVRLRPENLAVLAERLERTLAVGDRTAATGVALRLREILESSKGSGPEPLAQLLDALERDDTKAARRAGRALTNVLKAEPFYRLGISELTQGIPGLPVVRFEDEPPPSSLGLPIDITFERKTVATGEASALAVGDVDADGRPDLVRMANGVIEVRSGSSGWKEVAMTVSAPAMRGVTLADIDNDRRLDVVTWGDGGLWVARQDGKLHLLIPVKEGVVHDASIFDFDMEGDLDVAVVVGTERRVVLHRNTPDGSFEEVTGAIPGEWTSGARAIEWSDLDRDGDPDLLIAGADGLAWLENLRQDRFRGHVVEAGEPMFGLAVGDVDGDGQPDVVASTRSGARIWRSIATGVTSEVIPNADAGDDADPEDEGRPGDETPALAIADIDNDGRLEVIVSRERGLHIVRCAGPDCGDLEVAARAEGGAGTSGLVAVDADADGDLDVVAAGPGGTTLFRNDGGNRNRWLTVGLRGLTKGSGKNNSFGIGATLEVRSGRATLWREVRGDTTHLGLGNRKDADVLRIVWTNGVPQNRLQVAGRQTVVEEQVLKGSCPFLYAWDGKRFAFATDLLWGAPLGMPVAPGRWAGWDARELVHVPIAKPRDGRYEMRITEELWEAAFLDRVRLWVVDHPADVEVASNFRIIPGETVDDRVVASRDVRPVAHARDARGRDVTDRVRERDERYASGFDRGAVQGVANAPGSFEFDLGMPVSGSIRLHLDGWIFPADASLNVSMGQGNGTDVVPPRLEVHTPSGWRTVMPHFGFPPGKTKTIVVDTPPLPAGSHRLRIVTTSWLAWDRIAWTTRPADDEPVVRAVLAPSVADLRPRGFSRLVRAAPNAPHAFLYDDVTSESPWLPLPGRYTRFGDVRELLGDADDRHVILAAGDEMAITFDARRVDGPAPGWKRTVFLESTGWDKDADRNTWAADSVEPLPFHAMTSYPYAPGESYPDDERLVDYRREWLTREIGSAN